MKLDSVTSSMTQFSTHAVVSCVWSFYLTVLISKSLSNVHIRTFLTVSFLANISIQQELFICRLKSVSTHPPHMRNSLDGRRPTPIGWSSEEE